MRRFLKGHAALREGIFKKAARLDERVGSVVSLLTDQESWQKKSPDFSLVGKTGAFNWQRPTLTGPIVPLPSAQESFTSGFGMGPGGSSLLWPPEGVFQRLMKNIL